MHKTIVLLLLVLFVVSASAQDWPQFRGAWADGVIEGGGTFRDRSGVGLAVRWSVALGSGYSGPVISGGRVFTLARDGEHDVMWAHDAATGKTLWRFEIEPTYRGHDGSHDGPIATPVVIGERVFGLSALGRLFALDAANGKLAWSTSLPDDHGATAPSYGFCTSPIAAAGKLVVMIGAENATVGAFDPTSGVELWTVGDAAVHFQTPSMVRDGEREVVLASGSDKLVAVDAGSGELLWEYEHGGSGGRGAASLTAVPTDERRLFLAFKDDASTLIAWDSGEEQEAAATFETLWEERSLRNSYNIAVYDEGHIYGFSNRLLTCVDEKTGEARWRSREPGDGFLMLADGHLVVATKSGSLHIVEATPETYREVASVQLFDDLIWSPPAFADGSIFVRGLGGLARIDVTDGALRIADDGAATSPPTDSAFAKFLARVQAAADDRERKVEIDGFFAAQQQFPVVEGEWVHFVVRSDGEDVAIAGDLFGLRQDRAMQHLEGTDLFWLSAQLAEDGRVDYLFIPDYGEPIRDPLNPRLEVSSIFGADMERPRGEPGLTMSWVAGSRWQPPGHLGELAEDRTGRLEEHELTGEDMEQPITLTVWLPPEYDAATEHDEVRFPALYIAPGQPALDDGHYDAVLANLVGDYTAPMIAVFVTIPVPDPNAAADLFADKIVPFIDESYRTVADREHRVLMGHGFAGFGAVITAVKHPESVSRVAMQSMHTLDFLIVQLEAVLAGRGEGTAPPQVDFLLEWSRYDIHNPHEAWDMREFNERVAKILEDSGFRVERSVTNEGPGWMGWRNRADDVLVRVFPK